MTPLTHPDHNAAVSDSDPALQTPDSAANFLQGFAWALPRAFAKAAARCRFEEGDMLYDSPAAYDADWNKALKHVKHTIQVHAPGRGLKVLKGGADSVFEKNWHSEVRLELQSPGADAPVRSVTTTQGRLYATLWHGDLSLLEPEAPEPARPLAFREAHKALAQALPYARVLGEGRPVFVMARDLASKTSQARSIKVESALRRQHAAVSHCVLPRQAGLEDWDRLSPTVEIVFHVMPSAAYDSIYDTLRLQLRTTGGKEEGDKEEGAKEEKGGFRLSAHGLLEMFDDQGNKPA